MTWKTLRREEVAKILRSMDQPISMYVFAREIQKAFKKKNGLTTARRVNHEQSGS